MMGRGIAEVAAAAGIQTHAIKLTEGSLDGPRQKIAAGLDRRVKKGKMTAEERDGVLSRITFSADLDAVRDAEIVVESVLEEMDAKTKLFAELEPKMHPEAVLGSNTSSLRLETLAAALARPERFVGLHFFSPVPAMELVELGTVRQTSPAAIARAEAFCRQIGKTPVRIQAAPGYVVNRLLVPYLLHGIETFEVGLADADGIDTAMRLGCGHPMGPLALSDLIGLDVVLAMAQTMRKELDDPRYRVPATLEKLCKAGELGRKTGIGIYV
jgi:3-hydroxybutyryl-CoA dehydrogenase